MKQCFRAKLDPTESCSLVSFHSPEKLGTATRTLALNGTHVGFHVLLGDTRYQPLPAGRMQSLKQRTLGRDLDSNLKGRERSERGDCIENRDSRKSVLGC